MHDCPECGMPYTSPTAATECAEMDRAEDATTARVIRHRHNHREGSMT